MSYLMWAALLAPGFDPQQPPPARPQTAPGQQQAQAMASNLDGTWMVLYAEKDGQKLADHQNQTVTIKGNVLTVNKDGQEHSIRLQFGPNHHLTATPEAGQHAAHTQARPGERQQAGSAEGRNQPAAGAAAKPGEQGQTPTARDQNSQRPGTALPAPAQGQTPGGPAVAHEPGSQGHHQAMAHEGVFIETNEFLCLALNQAFEGETHGQPATAAATTPAPKTTLTQPAQSTPRPGQPAPAGQQPTAPAAQRTQPGNNQQAAAGQPHAVNELPGQPGGIRTANYTPGAGNMQHSGFVLILRRQSGQQPTGQQPAGQQPTSQQPANQRQQGIGAK
jgi:hypothetical protein